MVHIAVPELMRAWQITELGEPAEVLAIDTVPTPTPGSGEVLLRVNAVAANFPDVLLARGEYQVRPEIPFTPGVECAGTVVAIGDGVTSVKLGERVVAMHIGLLSEYAVVPAVAVLPVPDALEDIAGAGLTIAYQTAWFALHRRAHIKRGEWLLVQAAAGGVGAAAVQLGVAAGARVIAVVGSEAKARIAAECGAEHVLLRGQDIVAEVKRFTGGHGVDVIFDPVGGDAFITSTKVVAFEGRIVVIGFASGEIPELAMNRPLIRNYGVLGLYGGLYQQDAPQLLVEAHTELVRLFEAGIISPVVDRVVEFADAPEAFTALAQGVTVGRAVVRIAS